MNVSPPVFCLERDLKGGFDCFDVFVVVAEVGASLCFAGAVNKNVVGDAVDLESVAYGTVLI